jgi:hypothetical protein
MEAKERQKLFDYFSQNYNVSLLDSDFNEIEHILSIQSQEWVKVEDRLPKDLETVWISNGKGWTTLGCRVYSDGDWSWAATNGVIYQEQGVIVAESEIDDLDVQFWMPLPTPPNK